MFESLYLVLDTMVRTPAMRVCAEQPISPVSQTYLAASCDEGFKDIGSVTNLANERDSMSDGDINARREWVRDTIIKNQD